MIRLTMPSGIHYELPFNSVSGKQDKLRSIFQTIIAIDRKAETLSSPPDNKHAWKLNTRGRWVCMDKKCPAKDIK